MATHAVAFAFEEDGLAVHHPSWIAAHIAAFGDGVDWTALGTDNALVGIGVASVGDVANDEPLAVGAPCIVEASALRVPCGTVGDFGNLFGCQVDGLELRAVFDEGDAFAVRAEGGIVPLRFFGRQEQFFLYKGGIGKVRVVFAYDACDAELPVAVAFGSIYQTSSVGCEVYGPLGTGGVCNLPGGVVFRGGDEHFSADDESHLFAVLAYGAALCSVGKGKVGNLRFVVTGERNVEACRFSPAALGIDFTVPGIA